MKTPDIADKNRCRQVGLKWNKNGTKSIVRRLSSFLTPINKCVNTYKQNRTRPINTDVKDIIKNNNKDYNSWRYKSDRDFTNFDFDRFYANNF